MTTNEKIGYLQLAILAGGSVSDAIVNLVDEVDRLSQPINKDAERVRFEIQFKHLNMERNESGKYVESPTYWLWKAWMRGAKSAKGLLK